MPELRTERLRLRGFEEADRAPFAAMNADRRVMERIGMTHDPTDDFDHPIYLGNDRIRPHVLYRLPRAS